MSYITTNHWLSPHTAVNDPLVNSLSVTVPGWLAVPMPHQHHPNEQWFLPGTKHLP